MNDDEKKLCTELWAQYEHTIRNYSEFKLQSNKDEIEDLIADVCLALCKKVHESGPPEKPREWLLKVCSNLLNGKYRDYYEKRDNETSYIDEEYEVPFGNKSPKDNEPKMLLEELIKKAGDRIDAQDRRILWYTFLGYKIKEMAELMNKSEAALKQKRHRLYIKLRKIYGEKEL